MQDSKSTESLLLLQFVPVLRIVVVVVDFSMLLLSPPRLEFMLAVSSSLSLLENAS